MIPEWICPLCPFILCRRIHIKSEKFKRKKPITYPIGHIRLINIMSTNSIDFARFRCKNNLRCPAICLTCWRLSPWDFCSSYPEDASLQTTEKIISEGRGRKKMRQRNAKQVLCSVSLSLYKSEITWRHTERLFPSVSVSDL